MTNIKSYSIYHKDQIWCRDVTGTQLTAGKRHGRKRNKVRDLMNHCLVLVVNIIIYAEHSHQYYRCLADSLLNKLEATDRSIPG